MTAISYFVACSIGILIGIALSWNNKIKVLDKMKDKLIFALQKEIFELKAEIERLKEIIGGKK